MQVLLERIGHRYRASSLSPFSETAEADTREEALSAIEEAIACGRLCFVGSYGSIACDLPILTFSADAMRRFETLKALHLNVGGNDLRIAAIALESGATVVTRNSRDFSRIPDLVCEDWSIA